MSEFWQLLTGPSGGFVLLALAMGALASVAFGVVGCLVVARRLSYLAGAIAHASLGGIGAALYLQRTAGWTWAEPVYGALLAAVLSGLAMAAVRAAAPEREDTLVGALWAVGMALGLLFLAATPGYADPMTFLVGDILLISEADLWRVALLDALLLVALIGFFPRIQALCFDEEFARLRGVSTGLYYLVLLIFIGLTVVLLLSVVGLVLVVALLTLAPATAGRFTRSLAPMMLGAVLISLLCVWSGIGLSFVRNWPTGPSIVLLAAIGYLGVSGAFWLRGRYLSRHVAEE